MTDEEKCPTLPEDTLRILSEFLVEKAKQEQLDELPPQAIEENWQLSQFWYTEDTSIRLVNECVEALKDAPTEQPLRIACLCAPTLMYYFLSRPEVIDGRIDVRLFEYDGRFEAMYKERFVHYDYKQPHAVSDELRGSFDSVIADPPFLADECLVKVAQTIKLLSRTPSTKVVLCTGLVMQELADRLLKVSQTCFKPEHNNNLANEFACYTNYKPVTL